MYPSGAVGIVDAIQKRDREGERESGKRRRGAQVALPRDPQGKKMTTGASKHKQSPLGQKRLKMDLILN